MTEHPILFSGPMVRALLEGRKTQTRRVIKPQPPSVEAVIKKSGCTVPYSWWKQDSLWNQRTKFLPTGCVWAVRELDELAANKGLRFPYGQPGDRLWVRETHFLHGCWQDVAAGEFGRYNDDPTWRFCPDREKGVMFPDNPPQEIAEGREAIGWFKRPSIFMPRWSSRITLEVTDVRVQRVQDISEEDAQAERDKAIGIGFMRPGLGMPGMDIITPYKVGFSMLWDSINAASGYGWEKNPWVWAVSFKIVERR